LVLDRSASVIVELLDPDMILLDATGRQLALGGNRALLGDELIQFARASPLGAGRWRLDALLRGRGGTEAAVNAHAVNESFVLLDASPIALDAAKIGSTPGAAIVAVGRGDAEPAASPIAL